MIQISEAESRVMQVLWEAAPRSAEEVIAALEAEGMVITQEKEQDGWCALLMQKA